MGSRILVIEDNPTNMELMTYLLTAFGHTTIAARDGEEGVEAALRHTPDLILCDLALPKLDGYGVARRLRAEPSLITMKMIAVTASALVGFLVGQSVTVVGGVGTSTWGGGPAAGGARGHLGLRIPHVC